MRRIYKYEIIRRSRAIFIFSGIMLMMTLVSIIFGLPYKDHSHTLENFPSYLSIWWVLTVMALTIIPFVMLFTCSNAHITEMLFKNTNYLMQTIPVPSWQIILGRWLAGLTEFVIYVLVSMICWISWAAVMSDGHSGSLLKAIFLNITKNPATILVVITFCFSFFALLGMTIIMIITLIRSFIKKRGITTAITIVAAIFFFSLLNDFASKLSDKLNWILEVPFTSYSYYSSDYNLVPHSRTLHFPMVIPIFWFIMGIVFFLIASFLLEKKVEV